MGRVHAVIAPSLPKVDRTALLELVKRGQVTFNVDLSGSDLSAIYLHGIDLKHSDMRNVNLTGAVLNRVNLSGVKLGGCNLSEAILVECPIQWSEILQTIPKLTTFIDVNTIDEISTPSHKMAGLIIVNTDRLHRSNVSRSIVDRRGF